MINLGVKVLSFTWMILLVGCGATSTTPLVTVPIRSGPALAAPAYANGDQWLYRVVRQTGKEEQIRIVYRNSKFEHDNQEIFDGTIWASVYRTDSELKPLNFPLTPGLVELPVPSHRREGSQKLARRRSQGHWPYGAAHNDRSWAV